MTVEGIELLGVTKIIPAYAVFFNEQIHVIFFGDKSEIIAGQYALSCQTSDRKHDLNQIRSTKVQAVLVSIYKSP